MNIVLIYFAIKYKGNWDLIFKALEDKEKVPMSEMNKLEEEIKNSKYHIITILDMNYPNKLKEAYKPPFVLWLKGDVELLKRKFISFTGNGSSELSLERIKEFGPEISKNYSFISASYKGIDVDVSENTKEPILYVLPNGLDKPQMNSVVKDADLLLTEYPPTKSPAKEHYANRNRIIAAFSESLILLNSKENGGINSLITNFLNLGKDVHCFIGDKEPFDGNAELIKQGANLITKIQDISN